MPCSATGGAATPHRSKGVAGIMDATTAVVTVAPAVIVTPVSTGVTATAAVPAPVIVAVAMAVARDTIHRLDQGAPHVQSILTRM